MELDDSQLSLLQETPPHPGHFISYSYLVSEHRPGCMRNENGTQSIKNGRARLPLCQESGVDHNRSAPVAGVYALCLSAAA